MKLKIVIGLLLLGILVFAVIPTRTTPSKFLRPINITSVDTGISGIDAIYCINLDIRKEKWAAMEQQFSEQHLHVNRVPAINGWTELTKKERSRLLAPDSVLNAGQIGCFLSHLSILKNASDHGFNKILILEDDVEFITPMQELEQYVEMVSEVDPDWDILYLDNWNLQERKLSQLFDRPHSTMSEIIKKPKEALPSSNLLRIYYRHDNHAMVVSKKGIQKMINHFFHNPFLLAIDTEINHIDQIRRYETGKKFVTTNYRISDTTHNPKKIKTVLGS